MRTAYTLFSAGRDYDSEDSFLFQANPHAWFLSAVDLHDQAFDIYQRREKAAVVSLYIDGKQASSLNGADRATYLLCGFSVENLIKGLLISRNPDLVSNGRLGKQILSHDLHRLFSQLNVPWTPTAASSRLLNLLSDAISSWARYPCGLRSSGSSDPAPMRPSEWRSYEALFRRLRNMLKADLKEGWVGPSGHLYGVWKIPGEF